jgi:glycosyltransferase involved in cell wall biosynthesis
MKNICHITTVHSRYDTRIFLKECSSLTKLYKVFLIVADGLGDEVKNGVFICDVGLRQKSRLKRARIDSRKAFKKAVKLNCDLYHFHDPELIKIGVKLKNLNYNVIYDVHEDLPKQIYGKHYLKNWMKPVVSNFVKYQEDNAAKKFDYVITATVSIKNRFLKINKNSFDINNYPILNELSNDILWSNKNQEICYVGGITKIRGVKDLLEAVRISNLDFILNLVGEYSPKKYKIELKKLLNKNNIKEYGYLNRVEVASILKKSKIGVVTFYSIPNHIDSQPNKMFEYMSAGIPVVSSNFPLWKEIVEGNNCGLIVDPKDPKEISSAIEKLLSNDNLAEEMGKNGKKAVFKKYNWGIEEKKLLDIYREILK